VKNPNIGEREKELKSIEFVAKQHNVTHDA